MLRKNRNQLVYAVILLIANFVVCDNCKALFSREHELRGDIKKLSLLGKKSYADKSQKISDFKDLVEELEKKWNEEEEYYARIIIEVCKLIGQSNFIDVTNRVQLARSYALSALEKRNEIEIKTELELVDFVVTGISNLRYDAMDKFEVSRKEDVDVRLHAWKRLLGSIDSDWDPNDWPRLSISPPVGIDGFTGISPEKIKDSLIREEYKAAIKENKRKSLKYSEQYELRKQLMRHVKAAEDYIVYTYSIPPYNLNELIESVNKYEFEDQIRDRIIERVRRQIKKERPKLVIP